MSEISASIQIKGLRDGLLATLSNAAWEDQRAVMLSQIDERPTFFRGARLAMDVGEQVLKVNELVELRDRLSERGVSLWAVVSESPTTETTAQLLGLATRISKPRPEELRHAPSDEVSDETALFINKTLRSGTRIEFPGHVVLLGDINPGAEIIAEGNVMVWGRLRGLVHAGSAGNREAIICALDVNDAQVRIANFSESKIQPEKQSIPQVISLDEDDKIKTQIWQAG
jgi:septum site-determining protein MinC